MDNLPFPTAIGPDGNLHEVNPDGSLGGLVIPVGGGGNGTSPVSAGNASTFDGTGIDQLIAEAEGLANGTVNPPADASSFGVGGIGGLGLGLGVTGNHGWWIILAGIAVIAMVSYERGR